MCTTSVTCLVRGTRGKVHAELNLLQHEKKVKGLNCGRELTRSQIGNLAASVPGANRKVRDQRFTKRCEVEWAMMRFIRMPMNRGKCICSGCGPGTCLFLYSGRASESNTTGHAATLNLVLHALVPSNEAQ